MWLLFALLSALITSVTRTIMKYCTGIANDKTIVFSRYIFATVPIPLLLVLTGIPPVGHEFYYSILLACAFDVVGIMLMTKALRYSSIAYSVPLLSLTPVFVLITGFVILGEFPSPLGLLGILVIVFGIYCLRLERNQRSFLEPFRLLFKNRGARYMLGTAALFSLTGIFFKKAILNSSPFLTMAVGMPLSALLLLLFHMITGNRIREILPDRRSLKLLFLSGISVFFVALTINLALSTGLVSYVGAIKRVSILFNMILGALLLHEEGLRRNLFAAGIIVAGIWLIAIS